VRQTGIRARRKINLRFYWYKSTNSDAASASADPIVRQTGIRARRKIIQAQYKVLSLLVLLSKSTNTDAARVQKDEYDEAIVCVLILLYVSSYYYMCPHTTMYVSSYYHKCVLILQYMCLHTTVYVSSYYCKCVLMLLYVSSYYYICVLILLYTCPHTSIYVSSYYYIRVLIGQVRRGPRRDPPQNLL
jgi:hypothetical protein